MSHTPTPLHVREINDQGNYMCHSYIYSGEELVATVTKPGCAHEIVEACNAHDALLAAARLVNDSPFKYASLGAYIGGTTGAFQVSAEAMMVVRAAIARAEGKKELETKKGETT